MEYRRITNIEDPLFKKMHQLMQTDLICNDHRGNADSGRAADVHEGNE